MIITAISPINFGPFSQNFIDPSALPAPSPERTPLLFSPQVTVLTGANDTGKSTVLRLLRLLYTQTQHVELDRNVDLRDKPWDADSRVGCRAWFQFSSSELAAVPEKMRDVEARLEVHYTSAPKGGRMDAVLKLGGRQIHHSFSPPILITLEPGASIRPTIDWRQPNATERRFLKLAFGADLETIRAMSTSNRRFRVRDAEKRLNARLRKVLPKAMGTMEFTLGIPEAEPYLIDVGLLDGHGGHVPVHLRGSGVQRLLALMAELSNVEPGKSAMVMLDEPENSLHADAQHLLRDVLENLADGEHIQVVYSTHSPSMINTMRPDGIRVLARTTFDGKSTSYFNNNPLAKNFGPVRAALGLTPADSLLLGEATIIVEGPTELRCLAAVLEKLRDAKAPGFEDVDRLLARCFMLSGEGDSFYRYAQIALEQHCKPHVLLDGDKAQEAQKLPDGVPCFILEPMGDFEELVSTSAYFSALSLVHKMDEPAADLQAEFEKWRAENKPKGNKRTFAGRVETWLQITREIALNKPRVMLKALTLTPEIDPRHLATLRRLVGTLRLSLIHPFE